MVVLSNRTFFCVIFSKRGSIFSKQPLHKKDLHVTVQTLYSLFSRATILGSICVILDMILEMKHSQLAKRTDSNFALSL